jgi:hypothetical protein
MRPWVYKLLITLTWLAVPLAGYYLARADYRRYQAESAVQLADCQARADVAARYAVLLQQQGARILQVDSADDMREWEIAWRELERALASGQKPLRPATPTHFPRTDAQLNEAEQLLETQMDLIETAQVRRGQYNRAQDTLSGMADTVAEVEAAAQYYKRIGAEGVYLLLMDDLAVLEDRFRQQQRYRQQLSRECSDALADAEDASRTAQRIIKHLDDQLAADEQTTYAEALRMRLKGFDPWAELRGKRRQPAR